MNQTCKVCGEPAAGFHFGAFTCEGCKSFFGRSYNNLPSISDCKNNNECVINKKNRTSCKSCRLRKCLMVGMSKSGSRYGRRSNWFKIHCLLEEQQHQAEQQARAKKFHGEHLVHLEKLNNNNSITCNKNLSPQISPKSFQIDEDKFTSTSPRILQSYEEKYPSLSPRISPRTFGYTDHSISPSSVDMNMNYYSMFPQILLANNYHYYHQIKYQNKRTLEDEDEISEPGSERKEEQDENKSKKRYSNENYHPYSSNQINILQKERYALDMQPKHRSHSRNLSSERDEHERLYTHPLVDVSFRPGHISDRDPMSDVEEQDVPIDLSVKSNVTEDKRMNVVCEDSDVDITTYGSDEETIDVTTVPRMKSSPLGLLDFRR